MPNTKKGRLPTLNYYNPKQFNFKNAGRLPRFELLRMLNMFNRQSKVLMNSNDNLKRRLRNNKIRVRKVVNELEKFVLEGD